MSSKEVYDKTSKILAAIEQCSCDHCLKILKSGLSNQLNTNTGANNPKDQSGVAYTSG